MSSEYTKDFSKVSELGIKYVDLWKLFGKRLALPTKECPEELIDIPDKNSEPSKAFKIFSMLTVFIR